MVSFIDFDLCNLFSISYWYEIFSYFNGFNDVNPILAQISISTPPKNVRKPKVLRLFQWVQKWNIGLKSSLCCNVFQTHGFFRAPLLMVFSGFFNIFVGLTNFDCTWYLRGKEKLVTLCQMIAKTALPYTFLVFTFVFLSATWLHSCQLRTTFKGSLTYPMLIIIRCFISSLGSTGVLKLAPVSYSRQAFKED